MDFSINSNAKRLLTEVLGRFSYFLFRGVGGGTGLVARLALGDEVCLGLTLFPALLHELRLLTRVLLMEAGIAILARRLILRRQACCFQSSRPVAEALGNVCAADHLAGSGRIGGVNAATHIVDKVGIAGSFVFYRKSLVLRLQGLAGTFDDLLMQSRLSPLTCGIFVSSWA